MRPTAKLRSVVAFSTLMLIATCSCSWRAAPVSLAGLNPALTSYIYASDGSLVTGLYGEEFRQLVSIEELPRHLIDAVVAIEDSRFWEHNGIDPRGIARAATSNVTEGEVVQGGSTITQQLVKKTLVGDERSIERKIREAALALQLENEYSKDRILTEYLNTVYFGAGAYGIQAAAITYFGIPAAGLTIFQAALLAGQIQAPSRTDPFQYPERALERRNVVLARMGELGLADPETIAWALSTPLILSPGKPQSAQYPAPFYVEAVKRFILEDPEFGEALETAGLSTSPEARQDMLYRGGLRIETPLNLYAQQLADESVRSVLPDDTYPDAALVHINPVNGQVIAFVGGRDFFSAAPDAKFDLATQGKRPAGSSFKTFVLAAALLQGYSLEHSYDAPGTITIEAEGLAPWKVSNADGGGRGTINLVEATVRSTNTYYAQLMRDVGPEYAMSVATEMGITSPLQANLSAVLGTNDVTPLEMASAYGTLQNHGLHIPPVFVTRVVASDGTVIFQETDDVRRAIPAPVADTVTGVLQQAVERGTGKSARIDRPVAGKTGTGQNYQDAWFVGYTAEAVASVWVGFAGGQIPMTPPATRIRVTGGSYPARIWAAYMGQVLAGTPASAFGTTAIAAGTPVSVPIVLGLSIDDARIRLAEAGLNVVVNEQPDPLATPGRVLGQLPGGGETLPAGSDVTLTVASGTSYVAVPRLIGLRDADAQRLLRLVGLAPGPIAEASPPGSTTSGFIWRQIPGESTQVPKGSAVTYSIEP
jgi:penicillin-binding protein 1A